MSVNDRARAPASFSFRRLIAAILLGMLLGGTGHAQTPAAPAGNAQTAQQSGQANEIEHAVADLASWVSQHGGHLGALFLELPSHRVLAAHDERALLNPASNMKIVTAAAALDLLGPAYRYSTGLYGKLRDNAIAPLVLRGHGDPSLGVGDLDRLAHALVDRGVRRVDGIRVDQSRFDNAFVPPAFAQQPNEWAAFRAPVSAVALEQNTVTLHVAPGAKGQPARIWFDPPGFVEIDGTVATVAQGQGQNVTLALSPSNQKLKARVGGHIAESLPELRFRRRVDDPRLYAGYVLAELLRRSGIVVAGTVETGGESETTRIAFIESSDLSVLLRELGKNSDNFYAETVFKTLGAETRGSPARSEDGATAAMAFLQRIGAADPGVQIRNGSGLFDADRLTARSLAEVLSYAYGNAKIGPDFLSQLAIGGVDGTLKSRFRRDASRYVVRAKTGTLERAVALSGYILAPHTSAVAFSLLVDGIAGQSTEIRQRLDACVDRAVDQIWRR